MLVKGFVYGCGAILFGMKILVCSLIYTFVMSAAIEKSHSQNISSKAVILTKNKYEFPILRRKMSESDMNPFAVASQGNSVYGNFEKRLES